MSSDRALPPKQNEELRRRLRELIAEGANLYPAWTLTAALRSPISG